jgi:hypothetical protein
VTCEYLDAPSFLSSGNIDRLSWCRSTLDGLELPACLLELAVDVAHLTLQGLRFAMVFTTFKPRVCHEVRRADFGRATRTERAEKALLE